MLPIPSATLIRSSMPTIDTDVASEFPGTVGGPYLDTAKRELPRRILRYRIAAERADGQSGEGRHARQPSSGRASVSLGLLARGRRAFERRTAHAPALHAHSAVGLITNHLGSRGDHTDYVTLGSGSASKPIPGGCMESQRYIARSCARMRKVGPLCSHSTGTEPIADHQVLRKRVE